MKNLTIIKSPRVHVFFAPSDWELYEHDECGIAASNLNSHLANAVNTLCYDKDKTRRYMLDMMATWAFIGALDTEPRAFLERILVEVFGE